MKTVLVCGGRDFADLTRKFPEDVYQKNLSEYDFVWERLDKLLEDTRSLTIVAGGATGVDTAAAEWALTVQATLKEYPAEWSKYGKAAGHIRNSQMLAHGKPDLVIAFPGGRGTANMVDQARRAGVEVQVVDYKNNKNEPERNQATGARSESKPGAVSK